MGKAPFSQLLNSGRRPLSSNGRPPRGGEAAPATAQNIAAGRTTNPEAHGTPFAARM